MTKQIQIEITNEELAGFATKLIELGKSLDMDLQKFTLMLNMCAKHLANANGIEITSINKMDS